MALFIFGAGATRGCSFVGKKIPCKPPLDADFFTQLQRIQNSKHKGLINTVIQDVTDIFGLNFEVSLETVFTTLEHTIKMLEVTGDSRDFKKSDIKRKRENLLQAIAAVFEESLNEPESAKFKECDHFKKFVSSILIQKDSIVSFNYDCVIDTSLKLYGDNKWNAKRGYCFQLGPKGTSFVGHEFWSPNKPSSESDTVKLLKLHGSLNFQIQRKKSGSGSISREIIKLKKRPYTKQGGTMLFNIIPPEWHKEYDKTFSRLWSEAAVSLNRESTLVFVGYSLPFTDLHTTALFRTGIKRGCLKSLVIINPDPEARLRTRSVVHRGLNKKTKVLSFDYFDEFLELKRSSWD